MRAKRHGGVTLAGQVRARFTKYPTFEFRYTTRELRVAASLPATTACDRLLDLTGVVCE